MLGRVACNVEAAYINCHRGYSDAPIYQEKDLIEPCSEQAARRFFELYFLPSELLSKQLMHMT